MTQNHRALSFILMLLSFHAGRAMESATFVRANNAHRLSLDQNWEVKSSCDIHVSGDLLSRSGFEHSGWLRTEVPSTVLAAQVNAGKFGNPFYGKNLLAIPGMDYPVGKIYANLPLTTGSPYGCSWWYRTEVEVPATWTDTVWLHFNGINYRGNIWVNGRQIANSDQVAGAYRSYEFDVTKWLKPGRRNVIAVETFVQTQDDLGINFVDWNPAPADKSMGLWRDVYMEHGGPLTLRNPAVSTHFTDDTLAKAELTVLVDVANSSEQTLTGVLRGNIGGIKFEQSVDLAAHQSRVVHFEPEQFPQLRLATPRVWWPYQYGTPSLNQLALEISVMGKRSDSRLLSFGIREVSGGLNDKGFLQFKVNRRNILIRGGGWSPDLFYREPRLRLQQELRYVKHLGLNTVRLEGKLGSEEIFNIADKMGILIMAGWCCCDHWEHWDKWTSRDHEIANASLYSQISRLRAHPSVFVWLNGSDGPPPAEVEGDYIAVLKEREWANPYISSASAKSTTVTGPSGVKMSGPYDYVPAEYWYLDKAKFGGAFGFNTETSAGPAIPSVRSVERTLPKENWWPIDDQWNYHAGLGKFAQYNIFTDAMKSSLGPAKDLSDFSRKSQLMTYDGERAMFEAYAANKYTSTGVVQWMLNNAWPSFIWHLYDYYLVPGGGYFGARKANELLHVQYRYDNRTVQVVNSTLEPRTALTVHARLFDLQSRLLSTDDDKVDLPADRVVSSATISQQPATTFLKLELRDKAGKLLSDNFYVLPKTLAELEWSQSNYFYTPAASYADLRDLGNLPMANVHATFTSRAANGHGDVQITNTGSSIAFFLHVMALTPGTHTEITPVLWSDNFISLLPGESRLLSYELPDQKGRRPIMRIEGWNLRSEDVTQMSDTIPAMPISR